jgi:hypothetical protein
VIARATRLGRVRVKGPGEAEAASAKTHRRSSIATNQCGLDRGRPQLGKLLVERCPTNVVGVTGNLES